MSVSLVDTTMHLKTAFTLGSEVSTRTPCVPYGTTGKCRAFSKGCEVTRGYPSQVLEPQSLLTLSVFFLATMKETALLQHILTTMTCCLPRSPRGKAKQTQTKDSETVNQNKAFSPFQLIFSGILSQPWKVKLRSRH